MKRFRVFARPAWKKNPDWPWGYEPSSTPQDQCRTVARFDDLEEVRDYCRSKNRKWKQHYDRGIDNLTDDKRRVYFEAQRYEFTDELRN